MGAGADGNITMGICHNRTIVSTCTKAVTADSCSLIIDGQQACEFQPACAPPAANNFDCANNPDTCCIASSRPQFNTTDVSACLAGNRTTSFAGLGCAVKQGCIQVVDPCAPIVTPWDCTADTRCTYAPAAAGTSLFGGVCKSRSNPCVGLPSAECAKTAPRCAYVSRCKSDLCVDKTDRCCGLSEDPAGCAASGCRPASKCLPLVDTCGALTATQCSAAAGCWFDDHAAACRLNATSHPCAAFTSPIDCYSAADANGNKICQVENTCTSACTQCGQCIAGAYAAVAALTSNPNITVTSTNVAAAVASFCASAGYGTLQCAALNSLVLTSPDGALGLRPARVCKALGACTQPCQVFPPSMPSADVKVRRRACCRPRRCQLACCRASRCARPRSVGEPGLAWPETSPPACAPHRWPSASAPPTAPPPAAPSAPPTSPSPPAPAAPTPTARA